MKHRGTIWAFAWRCRCGRVLRFERRRRVVPVEMLVEAEAKIAELTRDLEAMGP